MSKFKITIDGIDAPGFGLWFGEMESGGLLMWHVAGPVPARSLPALGSVCLIRAEWFEDGARVERVGWAFKSYEIASELDEERVATFLGVGPLYAPVGSEEARLARSLELRDALGVQLATALARVAELEGAEGARGSE